MYNNVLFHYAAFKSLLLAKLVNIKNDLIERITNIYIWAGSTIYVSAYLMQSFGLSDNFGIFQLGGIFAVVGLFELYGHTAILVEDINGNGTLQYHFTLPTFTPVAGLSYVVYYLIINLSMSLSLLPLGKILLWNQFSFARVAWGKFIFFLTLINLCWGLLTFVLAAHISSIEKLGIVWCRVIFPLWFLGGFQFSWSATYVTSPFLAYIMLLNPVIYATEGIRATLQGQEGFLPFWVCFLVMVGLNLVFGVWANRAIRRRLDLV